MEKLEKKTDIWDELKVKLKNGLPMAAFYLALFYAIWFLFGPQYGFVASVTGTAFDFNFKKRRTFSELLILALTQMIACSFACLASVNIVLRLTLNALFPLVWVVLRSSPVDNKGYFVGVITFVFIQLIPFGPDEIPYLLGIAAFATAALVITLTMISLFKPRHIDDVIIRDGLRLIARQMSEGERNTDAIVNKEHSLFKMAYSGHNVMHIFPRGEHVYFIFALILQRAAYFFEDQKNIPAEVRKIMDRPKRELAAFLMRTADEMDQTDNSELIAQARRLLKEEDELQERFGAFYSNILRLTALALREITQGGAHKERFNLSRYMKDLKNHLELNTFEFRFALRLSIVMTVSFAVINLTGWEHAYWMALNAFVITQPMYEDSVTRVQTRLAGSVVGCMAAYAAFILAPSDWWIYLFFVVMIICMYMSTPGKWVQPIFATACGVAMASITLGGRAAVWYRLAYLGMAAALVYCVNRFIFPSTKQRKNDFYIHEIYQMQMFYVEMLKQSISQRVSLTILRNVLVNFHILCDDLRREGGGVYTEELRGFLICLWRMMAEAEQMIVYLHMEKPSEAELESIEKWIDAVRVKLENREAFDPNVIEPLKLNERPFFSHLSARYVLNLSAALRMASWTDIMPKLKSTENG